MVLCQCSLYSSNTITNDSSGSEAYSLNNTKYNSYKPIAKLVTLRLLVSGHPNKESPLKKIVFQLLLQGKATDHNQ